MRKVMLVHSSGERYFGWVGDDYGSLYFDVMTVDVSRTPNRINNGALRPLGFHIEEIEEPLLITKKQYEDAWSKNYQLDTRPRTTSEFIWERLKKASKEEK